MKVTHSKIGPDLYEVLVDRKKVAEVAKRVDREDHIDRRGRNRPRNVTRFVLRGQTRLPKHPSGEEATMHAVKEWVGKNVLEAEL